MSTPGPKHGPIRRTTTNIAKAAKSCKQAARDTFDFVKHVCGKVKTACRRRGRYQPCENSACGVVNFCGEECKQRYLEHYRNYGARVRVGKEPAEKLHSYF